jgi:hypothetical protein
MESFPNVPTGVREGAPAFHTNFITEKSEKRKALAGDPPYEIHPAKNFQSAHPTVLRNCFLVEVMLVLLSWKIPREVPNFGPAAGPHLKYHTLSIA